MRRCITFSLIQLIFLVGYGQEEKHYNFIHYPPESGIASNQVNTAVQDEQGYIWMGGTRGLQRFDGIRFKTFAHRDGDPGSLPSNPVWQVMMDKKKNLWLLLADGKAGIFDTRHFIFREVPVTFRLPVSPVTALKRLVCDEEGNVFYLISGSEVITYNEQRKAFSYEYNFFRYDTGWRISDFAPQPGTGKYWLAIENGGIAVYNKTTGILSSGNSNTENEPAVSAFDKAATCTNLFFDAQKRLWSVSNNGHDLVSCYSLLTNKFVIKEYSPGGQVSSYYNVKRFMQQRDGSIWIYGMLLLAHFRENDNRFEIVHNGYTNERSIAYEMVHCLYEDRENNIWVCTDNNGLYRFNPSKEFFANVYHNRKKGNKRGDGQVLSFAYTRWNTLLTGTWNDGLYEYDDKLNPVALSIKGMGNGQKPFIWSMAVSGDSNTLWMGAEPGFYAVDQLTREAKYFNPPVLGNATVRQVAEDRHGRIWLGTHNKGVFIVAPGRLHRGIENIAAVADIPAVQVNKITIDSRGQVWVGTPENGLYTVNAATGKLLMHFGDGEPGDMQLPERGISSVLEYSDSIMLITTATRLVKYNVFTKKLQPVGGVGIISGFITAVEKDRNGYAWITSTSGLYQVDIQKGIFIIYDRTDGLDNEHFVQSASSVLPGGRIVFGATHNFISFMPEEIKSSHYIPVVGITDIRLKNEGLNTDSVLALQELKLEYDDNPLVIEFSPFLYSSPHLLKYKMEALDKNWSQSYRTYQAVYNYLPPGRYSFIIQPSDDMGNELPGMIMLKIYVSSPFWKTWWFYTMIAVFAGVILYWLDRERMSRKEAIHTMRAAIADDLHEEVNTALNNINILSEMARIKADNEPQKSKEFIEQISARSNNMIAAMDDMLWSISPENDSMEKTIARLRELIESLKNRYGVNIDLLADEKVKKLQLNMKQRKEVFWFLKSGITNVVRTGGSNCLVHIVYEKSTLQYTLEFETTHSDMQQLLSLRERQELTDKLAAVNAKLEVIDLRTRTIYVLTIPV